MTTTKQNTTIPEPTGTCCAPTERSPQSPELYHQAARLHDHLGELMRMVQLRDRDCICCHDLSVTQCHALKALCARPMKLNELAAALYLEKSTTSRVIDALLKKGYVTRERHPEDGRARVLAVTESGRRLFLEIEQQLIQGIQHLIVDIDPALRENVLELFARLVKAASTCIDVGSGCCRWRRD